jgi:hypothetical protein
VTEDLRIGEMAGDPEYQFGQLAFIEVGQDGSIYAMDIQSQEGRVYDAQGNYLRTIGSPGQGPGEIGLGTVFMFATPDGEIWIPDQGNLRVSRFDLQGDFLGSFPIHMEAGAPLRWAMDPEGRLVAQLRGLNVQGMAALEEGDPIVAYDTTGAVVDTVALLPKGQMLEGLSEGQVSILLFAPEPVWALGEDGSVFYAMTNDYRIMVNAPDGNLERIITREFQRKPVEETDQNAIRQTLREQYAQFGLAPAQIDVIMQGIRFAEFYPAFGNFFQGPEGSIWVQRIRSARDMAEGAEEGFEFDPQDIGSPEWEVLDSEGRYLGVVTLPDRFQPVNVKGDMLYGVWRDDLDVQYIMRLKVNRPGN